MLFRTFVIGTGLAFFSGNVFAQEALIKRVTPLGLSNTVNQIRVDFSEPMVNLSSPSENADVFTLSCLPQAKGRPRWNDDKTWVFDFDTDLEGNFVPGGTRCQLSLKPDVKSLKGRLVGGVRNYTFEVDGPNVLRITPTRWGAEDPAIAEDQIFVLQLDSEVDLKSVLNQVHLVVDGKASTVPVRLVEGSEREQILRAQFGRNLPKSPLVLLQARERFPAKARVTLVWGPGIVAKGGGARKLKATYGFRVRDELRAQFTCSRENAKADCSPITPLELEFSEPIATSLAQQIRLVMPDGKVIRPDLKRNKERTVRRVVFQGPFPENAAFRIELPASIRDDADRPLANQASFPLTVKTAGFPPLAKFSAKFGVIEAAQSPVMLPATLRNLEAQVAGRYAATSVGGAAVKLSSANFAEVVKWLRAVDERSAYDGRDKSLFEKRRDQLKFNVPLGKHGKTFEVVGIPLPGPGFYVVELESRILGRSLLGADRSMYVPTAVLVTNLAVHVKWGLESSLFWVTDLANGQPVAGATVQLHDCAGTSVWSGQSDKDGLARLNANLKAMVKLNGCQSESAWGTYRAGFFVTAQKGRDFTFTHSTWSSGLESFRFGDFSTLDPSGSNLSPEAHTVFARTLLRAGETVHMKHFWRMPSSAGFAEVAPKDLPTQVWVEHEGSGTKLTLPLTWDAKALVAETVLDLPKEAKLGRYQVSLVKGPEAEPIPAGTFRVDEFKIPLMRAVMSLPDTALVQPGEIKPELTVAYQAGGPAANLDVVVRHQVTDARFTPIAEYGDFAFAAKPVKEGVQRRGEESEAKDEVVTQKTKLSAAGSGSVRIGGLADLTSPKTVQIEMEFRDANGELQTVSRSATVWPSERLVGVRAPYWIAEDKDIDLQVVVLDLKQKPVANASVAVTPFSVENYSHRKRLVGGFYAYETFTETRRLSSAVKCSGQTDARGLVFCSVRADRSGQIVLQVETQDQKGRKSYANASAWVRGKDDWWFETEDTDRIDLVPERRRYEPGEVARLQVRMPFRQATALVTTEREGVISARVERLTGENPVIELPVAEMFSPNVYVSTFLIRGRVPDAMGQKPRPGQEFLVDLNKPAFKMGATQLFVNWRAHELKVAVSPNKEIYQPREEASVKIQVKDAAGKPVVGEVALAVVDEGLLQLQENRSWNLLELMMGRRPWAVQTMTAQMHVVGKRHFGQKAVAIGGDGGRQPTRELFDTLVTWQGRIKLNERGEAVAKFKLNDSLTSFRVVAVASAGLTRFGTGQANLVSSQDLMALPAVAKVARPGDRFENDITVRNTTQKAISAAVSGRVSFSFADGRKQAVDIGRREVALKAGEGQVVPVGKVDVPVGAVRAEYEYVVEGNGKTDRVVVVQEIRPLLVARTQMSQFGKVATKPISIEVALPKDATTHDGGVKVVLLDSLARGLDSVREYYSDLVCTNVETLISQAVATRDAVVWKMAMSLIGAQLDADGLVKWYPGLNLGSFELTSYILAIAHDAGREIPADTREKMLGGLRTLADGMMRRERVAHLNERELLLLRISAMAAISRYGLAHADWLKLVTLPILEQMPTVSLIDWLRVVQQVASGAVRTEISAPVVAALQNRLTKVGTRLELARDRQAIWWLMSSRAASQARLIGALLDSPSLTKAWQADLPLLLMGLMNDMRKGAWDMSVTNAWATVALEKFAKRLESGGVTGNTQVALNDQLRTVDWGKSPRGEVVDFAWPKEKEAHGQVTISHKGTGSPWAIVSTRAAIPTKGETFAGLQVKKSTRIVSENAGASPRRGDVVEVTLKIKAQAPTAQVALFDPIPSGAKILSAGLRADDPRSTGWIFPDYDEKSYDGYRAVYGYLTANEFEVVYRYQLNVAGSFRLPATRLEALYTPETFAELANASVTVAP